MKTLNKLPIPALIVVACLLASQAVSAAPGGGGGGGGGPTPSWTDLLAQSTGFVIPTALGGGIAGATVNFSPSPAFDVRYFSGNLNPQSSAGILTELQSQFGPTFTSASQCDSPTSGCTNASAVAASGLYDFTYTSTTPYNFMAIHFGQAELVFAFASNVAAGTPFSIGTDIGTGLSNYRTYIGPQQGPGPGTVPIPAAIWMVGSALFGAFGFARRKGKADA